MLPEQLHSHEDAASLEAALPSAIVTGKFDRDELTLEIEPDQILAVLRHCKSDAKYERLSSVTAARGLGRASAA
jgi:NADH:ubiquinone oxidoreductase subunit C